MWDIKELKLYYIRASELSIESNYVLWGMRVVVWQKLRSRILEEIYTSHMEMNKMKVVARSIVWWPSIDKKIENLARS